MKRTLIVALATVGIAGIGVIPAQAATPKDHDHNPRNCTAIEYRALHTGQTKAQVKAILDGNGVRDAITHAAGHTAELRVYGSGWSNRWCEVEYLDGRLYVKARV